MKKIEKLDKILKSKCDFCEKSSMKKIITTNHEGISNGKVVKVLNELDFLEYSIINDDSIKFCHPESKIEATFNVHKSMITIDKNLSVKVDEIIKVCKCNTDVSKVFYYHPIHLINTGIDIVTDNQTISFYNKEQQFSVYNIPQNNLAWQMSKPTFTKHCQAQDFIGLFKTKEHIQNFCILH